MYIAWGLVSNEESEVGVCSYLTHGRAQLWSVSEQYKRMGGQDNSHPSQDGFYWGSIPFNCLHVVRNQALPQHKIRECLGHEATIRVHKDRSHNLCVPFTSTMIAEEHPTNAIKYFLQLLRSRDRLCFMSPSRDITKKETLY